MLFSLRSRTGQEFSTSIILVQHNIENFSKSDSEGKINIEMKKYNDLFSDDIMCTGNPKHSIKKQLEPRKQWSKVVEYKIDITEALEFYTSRINSKMKLVPNVVA